MVEVERAATFIKNFNSEKRNLPFVSVSIIEKAVAANAVIRHAFDHRHFNRPKFIRFAAMMTKKIVAGRNVKMADFHRDNDTIAGKRRERLRVFYRSHERTRDRIGSNHPAKPR